MKDKCRKSIDNMIETRATKASDVLEACGKYIVQPAPFEAAGRFESKLVFGKDTYISPADKVTTYQRAGVEAELPTRTQTNMSALQICLHYYKQVLASATGLTARLYVMSCPIKLFNQ